MALFGSEAQGEIVVDGIPDDIVERLERRVTEDRWLGVEAASKYRVCDRVERPSTYREGSRRPSSIRVQLVTAARLGPMLEDVELDFTEPRRVRFRARFPRARKGSFVLGGFVGGVFGLFALGAGAALDRGFGVFFGIIAVVLFAFLTLFGTADTKQQSRRTIEKILREEIAASRNDARLRAELGGAHAPADATAQAVLSVLHARGIAVTDADRARVLDAADRETLDDWLRKAATATRISDVLGQSGGVRVEIADDADPDDEPVSVRARRGSG